MSDATSFTIAPETGAKSLGAGRQPTRELTSSTRNDVRNPFGVLDSPPASASDRIKSGIIYYEIEKREKYEDIDERVDLDLAIGKTQRYHFDDEPFIHSLHSIRFDLDRPYELLVESLLALRCRGPSEKKDPSPQEFGSSRRAIPTPQYSPLVPLSDMDLHPRLLRLFPLLKVNRFNKGARPVKSWELIPPSKGWMCEGNDVEGKRVTEDVPDA
ncbi:hypothetical protein PIB30_096596 [Stylosanthes scabra]|uniref:Uncharacterized protein n=1 Tax=Stylosanthes scabra TaxID=79078 RepID=A0ABU6UUZ4_9FABA|nr:hypothetical protein [Stylosanthes scabra]